MHNNEPEVSPANPPARDLNATEITTKKVMVSANLVPRSHTAKGKGISSCMYILEVFYYQINVIMITTLYKVMLSLGYSALLCLSANKLNYFLSSSFTGRPRDSHFIFFLFNESCSSTRYLIDKSDAKCP